MITNGLLYQIDRGFQDIDADFRWQNYRFTVSLPVAMYGEFRHSGTLKAIDNFDADWQSIEDRKWVSI